MVVRIVVVAFTLALTPATALAFDCSKASTAVEKAICMEPKLRVQDDQLSTLYTAVKSVSTAGEQKMLARAQHQWIVEREEACGESDTATCVFDKTAERIDLFSVKPESGPGGGPAMIPVFAAQEGDAKHYTVAFNLARFTSPKTAGEKLFNTEIEKVMRDAPLGAHDRETGPDHILESDADITLSYASPKLLSAAVTSWSDDGGAHGNGNSFNININLASGKALNIRDLFDTAAEAKLRALCRDQIVAEKKERNDSDYKVEDDSFLSDKVIAEHIANLGRWSLTASEVTVTFDSYAIGAYVEGSYDCTFPLADLKALAKAGAPLPD